RLKESHGFRVHKLKAGVFHPDYELECYRALAQETGDDLLRYDPNGAMSVGQARRFGTAIADLPNEYFEDPVWGLNGLRQLRDLGLQLATNTVVVNFEQLASN